MNKLEELRAAYAVSTPGEWFEEFQRDDDVFYVTSTHGGQIGAIQNWGTAEGSANANFIALAHELMPALLDAYELLGYLEAKFTEACAHDRKLNDEERIPTGEDYNVMFSYCYAALSSIRRHRASYAP